MGEQPPRRARSSREGALAGEEGGRVEGRQPPQARHRQIDWGGITNAGETPEAPAAGDYSLLDCGFRLLLLRE